MIRAFVGLPLPDDAAAALIAAQAGLPEGHPVPRENLHVTLAFLGERPMPVIEDVHFALDRLRAPGFSIGFKGLDLLGGERSRAVAALVRAEPALQFLRDRVVEAARSAGLAFPRERYLPHATIARLPARLAPDARLRLEHVVAARAALAAGPWPIDRFALFRSRLGRSGPIYEEMAAYTLAPAAAARATAP